MARPRQPLSVLQSKGKKHLTKAEIEEREKTEIKAAANKVKPPSYLTAEQKRIFKKYAKELQDVDIIANLDVDTLARFAISQDAVNKLNTMQAERPELLTDKDFQLIVNGKLDQCRKLSQDLGLNIASRCKIIPPQIKEEESKNKFSRFRK